jgi:hypothetical protein
MMIAIIACGMTRCDYLRGKGSLNLQIAFDVQMAEHEIGRELKNIAPVNWHAA